MADGPDLQRPAQPAHTQGAVKITNPTTPAFALSFSFFKKHFIQHVKMVCYKMVCYKMGHIDIVKCLDRDKLAYFLKYLAFLGTTSIHNLFF